MKILNVVGARPNFPKMAPLIRAMRRHPDLSLCLVHTGQHYDARMSDTFFSALELPTPEHFLGVGSGSHAAQTARVMLAFEPVLLQERPDLVVVVGDVNSTLACALVAAKLQIPVAHVEAGLRSFDRTMPEEHNRVLTDHLSDFLFTPSRDADLNLLREGIPSDRIHFVGNVMIDTLLRHRGQAEELRMPERLGVPPGGYAVLTLHRPSNVDDPQMLARLVGVVCATAERLPTVWPIHPRTRGMLEQFSFWPQLAPCAGPEPDGTRRPARGSAAARLTLVEPLGYLEFLGLMAGARVVLTDSGGIQEETTALGVPCLTLRESTERPVTVSEGTNQVVGTAPERILSALDQVLERGTGRDAAQALSSHGRTPPPAGRQAPEKRLPEGWDGHAAERIVAILRRAFDAPAAQELTLDRTPDAAGIGGISSP